MVMNLTMKDGHSPAVWDDEDATEQLTRRTPDLHSFVPSHRLGTWTAADDDPDELARGRSYSTWIWSCTALDKRTGRCTRWDTRPALCAAYEPASGDGLCVFSQPLENGEESAL